MKNLFLHLGLKKLVKKMTSKEIENFKLEYQCFRNCQGKYYPNITKFIVMVNEYVKRESKKRKRY